jgi:hypothetical protein
MARRLAARAAARPSGAAQVSCGSSRKAEVRIASSLRIGNYLPFSSSGGAAVARDHWAHPGIISERPQHAAGVEGGNPQRGQVAAHDGGRRVMAVYEPKGSGKWCYKFVWHGVTIRESTRNKGVAGVPAVSSGEVGCHNGWGNCHLRLRAQKDGLEVSSINRELLVLRPPVSLGPRVGEDDQGVPGEAAASEWVFPAPTRRGWCGLAGWWESAAHAVTGNGMGRAAVITLWPW